MYTVQIYHNNSVKKGKEVSDAQFRHAGHFIRYTYCITGFRDSVSVPGVLIEWRQFQSKKCLVEERVSDGTAMQKLKTGIRGDGGSLKLMFRLVVVMKWCWKCQAVSNRSHEHYRVIISALQIMVFPVTLLEHESTFGNVRFSFAADYRTTAIT